MWSDPDKLADRRRVPAYYREIYRQYQMPADWLPDLAKKARLCGLDFMCTTYLSEDIELVVPYVERWKVASFEANDFDFIAAHPNDRPLIVSTGMMNAYELGKLAIHCRERCNHDTTFLHCTSKYPCPPQLANVSAVRQMRDTLRAKVGLSDHTANPLTGALAVSMGAEVIEAHIRNWRTEPANPDYLTALSPKQAYDYVANVREAEKMLGDGVKVPQQGELMEYRVCSG